MTNGATTGFGIYDQRLDKILDGTDANLKEQGAGAFFQRDYCLFLPSRNSFEMPIHNTIMSYDAWLGERRAP